MANKKSDKKQGISHTAFWRQREKKDRPRKKRKGGGGKLQTPTTEDMTGLRIFDSRSAANQVGRATGGGGGAEKKEIGRQTAKQEVTN